MEPEIKMSKKNWNKLVTSRTLKEGDRILVDDPDGRMHEAIVDAVYPCLFRRGCNEIVFKEKINGQRFIIVQASTKVIKLLDDYKVRYDDPNRLDHCTVASLKHMTIHFVDLDLTVTGGVA